MMSKERELLKKVVVNHDSPYGWELMEEIEKLLAQPEQSNEPVAWRWKKTSGWAYQDNNNNGGEPLYTSPPKREPLSDEPIQDYLKSYNQEISYDYEQGFEDGVEWAEHQHGIGVDDE